MTSLTMRGANFSRLGNQSSEFDLRGNESELGLDLPLDGSLLSDLLDIGYEAREVYLLNQPLQCLLIVLIICLGVIFNSLVIHNISTNDLKVRSVNFLLIKNLCISDMVGACLVLPMPLVVTAKGIWDFGPVICTANSIINITLWLQHIIMFAMLKVDRVLASSLPIGKYPLLSVEVVTVIIVCTWLFSLSMASLVSFVFNASYEPAVVLCIPQLPVEFFITVFSVYCLVLFAMVTGYIFVLIHLKKKQAQISNQNGVRLVDYKALERAALTSFLITISHFLLYVPTMMVIGLHGWFLHPIAILFCDMVVYSEFLIHPLVLFGTSTKLRGEVKNTLKKLAKATLPWVWKVFADLHWLYQTWCPCHNSNTLRTARKSDQIYATVKEHQITKKIDSHLQIMVSGGSCLAAERTASVLDLYLHDHQTHGHDGDSGKSFSSSDESYHESKTKKHPAEVTRTLITTVQVEVVSQRPGGRSISRETPHQPTSGLSSPVFAHQEDDPEAKTESIREKRIMSRPLTAPAQGARRCLKVLKKRRSLHLPRSATFETETSWLSQMSTPSHSNGTIAGDRRHSLMVCSNFNLGGDESLDQLIGPSMTLLKKRTSSITSEELRKMISHGRLEREKSNNDEQLPHSIVQFPSDVILVEEVSKVKSEIFI